MAQNIVLNPELLENQGEELVNYSEQLADILRSIDTKINEIIENWYGMAQDSYFELYNEIKKSLDTVPGVVDTLGKAAIETSNAFQEVDETLSNQFRSAL